MFVSNLQLRLLCGLGGVRWFLSHLSEFKRRHWQSFWKMKRKDRKEDHYFRGFMQFPHAGNSHYLSGCHRESYTLSMGDTLQLWEGHECPLSAGSQWEGLAWTGVMQLPHEFVKLEQSLALQHRYSRVSRCHALIFTFLVGIVKRRGPLKGLAGVLNETSLPEWHAVVITPILQVRSSMERSPFPRTRRLLQQ